ncbi:thyrotropin-releasing hormone receptor-like [Ylistrum balloti]|uniref:thyrotropin-releasing hormone receptor-like n=1 Tax=Ylistrum balloti TaxID=509963 RepID=UPI002905CD10|nr:thyrotropin-releasing hormone receptor-like [Ylistrum balloti]
MTENTTMSVFNISLTPTSLPPALVEADNTEQLRITRLVVQNILVPLVVALGLTGNILSIIVLTHRSMRTSTNCYLATLAIFDMLYLLMSFSLSFKHYGDLGDARVYKYWFPVARVLTDICGNVSVCLTVTFTVERYIAVCLPMRGHVICTPERARIIALLVVLFAIVSTSPEFFEWEVSEKIVNNVTIVEVIDTELGKSNTYQLGYYWYIAVMFTFVPLFCIWTFNSILIYTVWKATMLRRRMTHVVSNRTHGERQQGDQQKITLMLISVGIVFIVCQIPSAFLIIFHTYLNNAEIVLSKAERNSMKIAGNVTNLLLLLNAAINFMLYSVMSTKFRRVFLRVVCRPCYGKKKKFNCTEYSYVTNQTSTRRCSHFRTTYDNRIHKDDNLTASLGTLLPQGRDNRRSWSPARSLGNLRYSSDSLHLDSTPIKGVPNGHSRSKNSMLDTNI